MIALWVLVAYVVILVGIGFVANRWLSGSGEDFFLASHGIGPVLMLLSVFGTTMTSFALVGSTGQSYKVGIGVYGLMASWAAIVHPMMFVWVGVPIWHLGRRYGFVTQVQLLRDRYQSELLGWVLFPVLVLLVLPYVVIGIQGAGATVGVVTKGVWSDGGGLPPWLTGAVVTAVVLFYVAYGGIRAAAWANALQTTVFILVAIVTFGAIASALGGPSAAIAAAAAKRPELLLRGDAFTQGQFMSYGLVGLSVATFPHLFQHWLTARSANTFKVVAIAHPVLVGLVWFPCVLIGVWAAGQLKLPPEDANKVLGAMVGKFAPSYVGSMLTAGIIVAVTASLDSQFLCLGTMFTHDVVEKITGKLDEAKRIQVSRAFMLLVAVAAYGLSLINSKSVFELGVWCFSGFTGLLPIVIGALYWRRATAAGAMASLAVTVVTWTAFFANSLGGHGGEPLALGVMPVTWVLLASTVAMVVVSLATKPPSDDVVRRYIRDATA